MLNQEMSHAPSNLIAIYSGNHYFCSISQIILHKVFCFALSAFFSRNQYYFMSDEHSIKLGCQEKVELRGLIPGFVANESFDVKIHRNIFGRKNWNLQMRV